jgi:hypothetical protein
MQRTVRQGYPRVSDVVGAGMTLEARWADWHRSAFTSESPSHVSVWRKP